MLDAGLQLASLGAALAVMTLTWGLSLRAADASLADIAWGLCLVAVAWVCVVAGPEASGRSTLIAVLVSVWGLRLAGYIGWRHEGEDRRYRAMRDKHAERFALCSLWSVFGLQAVVAWVVSLPIQVAATDGTPTAVGVLAVVGAVVCVAAIAFETVADLQLAAAERTPVTAITHLVPGRRLPPATRPSSRCERLRATDGRRHQDAIGRFSCSSG